MRYVNEDDKLQEEYEQTQTQKVIDFIKNNDFKNALKIAKTFRLGFSKEEKSIIARASEMFTNEKFYKQLGFDKETEVSKAIKILKDKYKIEEEFYIDSNDLYEMANFRPKSTGLNMVIYVSEKNSNHGARIKVSSIYGDKISFNKMFVVTISNNPKVIGDIGNIKNEDIEKIKKFILINQNVLLQYWNRLIDTNDLVSNLKKI